MISISKNGANNLRSDGGKKFKINSQPLKHYLRSDYLMNKTIPMGDWRLKQRLGLMIQVEMSMSSKDVKLTNFLRDNPTWVCIFFFLNEQDNVRKFELKDHNSKVTMKR